MKVRSLVSAAAVACVLASPAAVRADNDAAGCAACGGAVILFWLGLVVLQIALLVWVARDAKARGTDSAIL
jgi:hypothetical protein